MWRARFAAIALGALTACQNPQANLDGGVCTPDAACTSGFYCATEINPCLGPGAALSPIGTWTSGSCIRDCSGGACSCTSNQECPLGECDHGTCLADPVAPIVCPVECPQSLASCLCAACPDIDAGQCLTWPSTGFCTGAAVTCACADGTPYDTACDEAPSCTDFCCAHGGEADAGVPDGGL